MLQRCVLTNNSTALDIRLSVDVPSTSSVEMYFRTSVDDVRKLGDVAWRDLMMVLIVNLLHHRRWYV